MTAKYWTEFYHARCGPKWQEWTLAVAIGLGVGIVVGFMLAML